MPMLKIAALVCACVLVAHGQSAPNLDAAQGIISAFDLYPIVAVDEAHRVEQDKAFLLSLVARPQFPTKVNDIVVEFGNARLQPVLDRYIAGKRVSYSELRKVWGDTTVVNGLWDAPVYERFFAAVRERNRGLPKKARLRMLACDPPIDWTRVSNLDEAAPFLGRDPFCASVLEHEVLAKGHHALVVMGAAHISCRHVTGRPLENAITLVERKHPGSVFVVLTYLGQFRDSASIEESLGAYPTPSLSLLQGTWLGALPAVGPKPPTRIRVGGGQAIAKQVEVKTPPRMEEVADALLYLCPQRLLTRSIPANDRFGPEDLRELERRHQLLFGLPLDQKALFQ